MGGRGGWGLRIQDAKTHCVAGRRLGFFSWPRAAQGGEPPSERNVTMSKQISAGDRPTPSLVLEDR